MNDDNGVFRFGRSVANMLAKKPTGKGARKLPQLQSKSPTMWLAQNKDNFGWVELFVGRLRQNKMKFSSFKFLSFFKQIKNR